MSTKKNKFSIYIYVVITIIGCVLACSSIVPNDYLKLVVVMGALGVGLDGIMKDMKINKDLVDATMMLSFIILVLIGTSDFSNMLLKEITMGSLAVLSVAMIALRFIHMRQEANSPKDEEYEY